MAQVSVFALLDCSAVYMTEAVKCLRTNHIDGAKAQAFKALAILEVVSATIMNEEESAVYRQALEAMDALSKRIVTR